MHAFSSNPTRRDKKIIFLLLLSQIREGEKKGRSLLHISERNKESRNKKRQITVAGHRCPVFSFIFFLPFFFFIYPFIVFSSFSLLAWAPVPIFLFFFFPPVPATCHFCPPFILFLFYEKKKKSDPAACHFCHASFLRLFRGKRRIANIPPLRHKMKTRRRSNPERRKEKIRVTGG